MSEMVTVGTRKLWTCLPGTPRWIVGWQRTSAGTRKLFLADQSSHPSSAFRFVPGILGHWHSWGQVFQWPLERNGKKLERNLFVYSVHTLAHRCSPGPAATNHARYDVTTVFAVAYDGKRYRCVLHLTKSNLIDAVHNEDTLWASILPA